VFFNDAVIRVRAPLTTDAYGVGHRDWDNAVETAIGGVEVQPSTQIEEVAPGRNMAVTRWWLLTPPGVDVDIEFTDRIRYAGRLMEMDGEVARWPDPSGGVHHVECVFREVRG